jgi:organic hydroperoxide reductase OsmC/OhrA
MSITQSEKVLYTAKAHTTGTNPEQLFTLDWSACFLSAVKLVAALAVHIMTNTALTGATYDIDGGQQLVAA